MEEWTAAVGLVAHPHASREVAREPEGVPSALAIEENAIEALARCYCREAGVRNLQQHVEKLLRKVRLRMRA